MVLDQTVPPNPGGGVLVSPVMRSVEERRAVGIFLDRFSMEAALNALKQASLSLDKLSILVKEDDEHTLSNPLLQGESIGSAASPDPEHSPCHRVFLPEVGMALMVGPDCDRLATVAPDYSVQSDAAALQQLDISVESALLYSRHLKNGAYLVTMRGCTEDMLPTASILSQHGMRDWGIYDLQYSHPIPS